MLTHCKWIARTSVRLQKLASVLDLAAAALSSLNLTGETDNAATGPPGPDATLTDRSKIFEAHASEYFKTLDVRTGGDGH